MASHGSRGKAIGFLGSVAGAMVEESEAPVLVVRA
jgi:nucleotide-binding universal stress UspA family protein